MAISAIGSLGTANDKNSATTDLSINPSRDVPAGRLVVIWVAWDSVFSVLDPNNAEGGWWAFDSQGHVYTLIAACTDRQGFLATGAWSGIFVTQTTVALETTDTITVEGEPGFVGSLVAKSMSVEEFNPGPNARWAQAGNGYTYIQTTADDPPAISGYDMELDREWLELHCLGNEGPDTDSFTWDSDWTQITGDGTTGGSDDSNVCVRGGYRIATETTASVDVSNTTAARDNTQCLTALTITKATAFPNTPILDNFNRADEYPVDGGIWNTVNEGFGSAFIPLVSNATTGSGGSFFDDLWEDCAECYVTVSTYRGQPMLDIMASGDTTVPSKAGVGVAWALLSDAKPVVADVILFGRSGNEGSVLRGHSFVYVAGADGVKWGLQRTRDPGGLDATRLWMDRGSGWEELAAIVRLLGQATTGYACLSAYTTGPGGSPPIQDDFGGGQISCFPDVLPQFIRRPWRYQGKPVEPNLP